MLQPRKSVKTARRVAVSQALMLLQFPSDIKAVTTFILPSIVVISNGKIHTASAVLPCGQVEVRVFDRKKRWFQCA